MKKVLVTGSSGFIGRHAAAEFQRRGYEVIPLRSSEVDLLDVEQMRMFVQRTKPTHLAHFAWYGEHGRIWDSRENTRWELASLELFREFLKNGGERAFFAGSCAEYEWSSQPLSEFDSPSNPISEYGRCKNMLRGLVNGVAAVNRWVGVTWGRIFFVYGPGEVETRLAPSILHRLLQNEQAVVRFGNHQRDFLHVEDVARAVGYLLDAPSMFPVNAVNIASGIGVNLGDFGKMLANIAGRPDLLKIEYGEPTPENPTSIVAELNLLPRTGFVPKYSLEEGLKTLLIT